MTITCDAIKYSYRQSKEGFVVAFVIHPQEMPEALANADIGSQWQLRLVELDKDGNAESEVVPAGRNEHQRSTDTPPRPVKASGGAKSWHEMAPAQQAGILCNDESFANFMYKKHHTYRSMNSAEAVRKYCGVKSRSEIRDNHISGKCWRELVSDYRAWMREPEVVRS